MTKTSIGLEEKLAAQNITLQNGDIEHLRPLYEKYKHLEGQKAIVMFSGGLDTSFTSHFLQHIIGAEVTTVTVDVGSVTAPANMKEVQERSKQLSVSDHCTIDKRDELAELGIEAIQAGAKLGQEGHHPASSLSRVAICDGIVQVAKERGVKAVFHGSNGSQNNPYRFKAALDYFKSKYEYPDLEECTPNLNNDIDNAVFRNVQKGYLQAAGVPSKSKEFEKNVSHDRNMLGDEWEEAIIAHTNERFDLREEGLKNLPIETGTHKIGIRFKDGKPVSFKLADEEWLDVKPAELLQKLNKVGLEYRIGIVDHPEERPIGINAREIHIAPAMNILHKAHDHLRSYCLEREIATKLNQLSLQWSRWVMEKNLYTHPLVRTMNRVFRAFDKDLDGEVFMDLEQEKITNITSEAAKVKMEGTTQSAGEAEIQTHTDNAIKRYQLTPAAYQEEMATGTNHATAKVRALRKAGFSSKRVFLENTLDRVSDAEVQMSL